MHFGPKNPVQVEFHKELTYTCTPKSMCVQLASVGQVALQTLPSAGSNCSKTTTNIPFQCNNLKTGPSPPSSVWYHWIDSSDREGV